MIRRLLASFATLTFCASIDAAGVDFAGDVLPILRDHCIDCHGPDAQESKLRLDSMVHALIGGDSGERAVVPGNSDQSFLMELVTSDDDTRRMPLDSDPLTQPQLDLLRAWIDDEQAWETPAGELARQTTDHWSLQPVVRPSIPVPLRESGQTRTSASDPNTTNAIDAFIERRLAADGLRMSGAADRRRLIRRLYLVMHGLPPTPQQVQAFVDDQRPRAWELLVEEVLASPAYGERMAMHWLDLVRFGETHGFETNRERIHAWHYRDWVIDAFNADKPYDEFVAQQIAGDAMGQDIGTGFLVAGPYDLVKGQDPRLGLIQRQDELADMINTTGTAFLGLTIGCARCHNHKFDPITQTDYYSMQAIFAGVNHADRKLPMTADAKNELADISRRISLLQVGLQRFVPSDSLQRRPAVNAKLNVEQFDAIQARFVRMTIDATNGSQPCIDELEIFADAENVALASCGAKASSSGDFVHPLHKLQQINDGEYGNAKSWIGKDSSGGWVQIELPAERSITRIVWARDREGKYGDRLATGYKIEVSTDRQQWTTVASSADRLPFTNKQNVTPSYDFDSFPEGVAQQGRDQLAELQQLRSRQQELETGTLVYAGTFSQPGPTHRLYRGEPGAPKEEVSPAAIAAIGQLDLARNSAEQERRIALAKWIVRPDHPLTARVLVNRLWHYHFGTGIVDTPSDFGRNGTLPTHPQLLDWLAAELVDSGWSIKHIQRLILTSNTWQQDSRPIDDAMRVDAASRLLWRFPPRRLEAEGIRDCILAATGKLDRTMGGRGFSAFEVAMENVRHYYPKQKFGPEDWRRMIYMTKVRQERDAVFGVFDCPDGSQVTPTRSRSTTPLQALNLLNSRFVMQQSGFLADRLDGECDSTEAKIQRAYALCFGRDPEPQETTAAAQFIDDYGLVQFCRAMFNANELVFIP